MRQSKVSAYYAARPAPAHVARAPDEDYQFVDLFCGIGGASQGAAQAGLRVVLAVDFDKFMLGVHELNHPDATHMNIEMPPQQPLPLPTTGKFHLHGSPPCNKVSRINKAVTPEQRKQGLSLVRWYLKFALASDATTFSMEQVPADCVLKVVQKFKRKHKGRLDYTVINCWDLGVPQTRKRLIAGTPALIEKLRRRRTVRRSVADVIAEPGGTHTRIEATASGTKAHRVINSWDDFCRPISRPAATVTARNGLRWATPHCGIEPHKMGTRDLLTIQSFPSDYELGKLSRANGRKGAGNALPPAAMRELLRPLFADQGS